MPPKKGKKVVGYQKAEPIAPGFVVTDARKVSYVTGEAVGEGGFGLIYLADVKGRQVDIDNARYVMKIEPKANGPLFQEINFYNRHCKESDILKFAKEKKIGVLGIPKFMSSGVIAYNGNDLRYLVMQRFGRDLQKVFDENGTFSRQLNAQIATKMLYSLEYMHRKRYAHADIKGANILLGNEVNDDKEELYLIDFGLAYLLPANPVEKPDPKARHDGTIEYCSTDAHSGCKPSFRGDLEILLWNLAHWASGDLPWLTLIKEGMPDSQKEKVASLKREMLANSDQFMSDLGIEDHKEIKQLLKYINAMKYSDEVDFKKVRGFFEPQLPSGNKLAFKQIKSRKSFVPGKKLPKVQRTVTPAPRKAASKVTPAKPKASSRKTPIANKSTAEKVKVAGRQGRATTSIIDESSDEEISFSRSRSRNDKTRKKSNDDEDDEYEPSLSKKRATTRARQTKRAMKTSTEEDSTEITVPIKQRAKKQALSTDSPAVRGSTRSRRNLSELKKAKETIAETSEEDIPKETPKRSTRKKASTVVPVQEARPRVDKLARMREVRDREEAKAKEAKAKKAKSRTRIPSSFDFVPFEEKQENIPSSKEDQENIPPSEEEQENIPPIVEQSLEEIAEFHAKKGINLDFSLDAETSMEITELSSSEEEDQSPPSPKVRKTDTSISAESSSDVRYSPKLKNKGTASEKKLPSFKVPERPLPALQGPFHPVEPTIKNRDSSSATPGTPPRGRISSPEKSVNSTASPTTSPAMPESTSPVHEITNKNAVKLSSRSNNLVPGFSGYVLPKSWENLKPTGQQYEGHDTYSVQCEHNSQLSELQCIELKGDAKEHIIEESVRAAEQLRIEREQQFFIDATQELLNLPGDFDTLSLWDLDNPNVKITFNEKTGPISAEFVGENGTSDKTAPFPPAPGKNYIGEIEEDVFQRLNDESRRAELSAKTARKKQMSSKRFNADC